MAVCKSIFTFKVVDGTSSKLEIESFIYNQKSKAVEPVSASSHSTPKHLKVPLGPLYSIDLVPEDKIEIKNNDGVSVILEFDKFNPLIDLKHSKVKEMLVSLHEKRSPIALVNSVQSLIEKLHGDDNSLIDHVQKEPLKGQSTPENETKNCFTDDENSEDESDDGYNTQVGTDNCNKSINGDGRDEAPNPRITRQLSLTIENGDVYNVKTSNSETVETGHGKRGVEDGLSSDNEDDEDFISEISNIIANAEYCFAEFEECKIPSRVKTDPDLIHSLKSLLQNTPDRTQTVIGLARKLDIKGKSGRSLVCVNAEVYVALFELALENRPSCLRNGTFLAISHTIPFESSLNLDSLVQYLNVNSKDFTERVKNGTTYQDLLRLSSTLVNNSNLGDEATKVSLREALRGFSKGMLVGYIID